MSFRDSFGASINATIVVVDVDIVVRSLTLAERYVVALSDRRGTLILKFDILNGRSVRPDIHVCSNSVRIDNTISNHMISADLFPIPFLLTTLEFDALPDILADREILDQVIVYIAAMLKVYPERASI